LPNQSRVAGDAGLFERGSNKIGVLTRIASGSPPSISPPQPSMSVQPRCTADDIEELVWTESGRLRVRNEDGRLPAAYGGNFDRLVQFKTQWDPTNLFSNNYNIPPG
jgi:hypothetical protein